MRIHSLLFHMRRHLSLSGQHAAREYCSVVYSPQEVSQGWHGWRPRLKVEAIQLPKQSELARDAGDGQFDQSRPRSQTCLATAVEAPAGSNNRVICIAGMHRSGTSMVARLLNHCGLYLGPEDELILPDPHNREGYWENRSFVETNNAILKQLGGGWDLPPAFWDGWHLQPALLPMRVRAAGLVQRFAAHNPWGWKDPRTSLTWAFWKNLIPELKLVICLRNPLEVARSLDQRGYSSNAFGFNLWLAYYQRLLSEVPPEDRIITHYESFFYDANAELRRLIDWLRLCPSEADVEHALAGISSSQRRNAADILALLQAGLPDEVLRVYSALCVEAGFVYHRRLAAESQASAPLDQRTLSPVHREFASVLKWSRLEAKFEATMEQLAEERRRHEAAMTDLNTQLSAQKEALAAQAQANQVLERQLAAARKDLNAIHSAKSWKLMSIYWRARYTILLPYRLFRQWLRNSLPN